MLIVIWPAFQPGTRLPGILFRDKFAPRTSALGIALVIFGIAFVASPGRMAAQRGGGAHVAKPVICIWDCPNTEGLSSVDDLKNFRRALALQATAEQRAAFAKIAQYAEAAGDQLQAFRKSLEQVSAASPLADHAITLDQSIERARASNQNFLTSFSPAQKSGLQEIARKLGKADSDLDKQIKALDQAVQTAKPDSAQIASFAAALDKALSSFQSEQLALGSEMSILFDPAGQGVTFSLPAVTNSISVDGQDISFPASGAVTRASGGTPADNGHNLFSIKFVADLSDLQQSITGILRSELTRSPRCGERIEIQQASLLPLAPSSLVVANLHFERWVCPAGRMQGSAVQGPTEVAAGDATLEVKLTPSLEPDTGLGLVSEITRVEADGLLRDSLRDGDLGVTLRQQIASALVSAVRKAADVKATLPPVARQSATVQKAQFQNEGADQLDLVVDGQLQFSDDETQQFAAQLKQRLSAEGTPAP